MGEKILAEAADGLKGKEEGGRSWLGASPPARSHLEPLLWAAPRRSICPPTSGGEDLRLEARGSFRLLLRTFTCCLLSYNRVRV